MLEENKDAAESAEEAKNEAVETSKEETTPASEEKPEEAAAESDPPAEAPEPEEASSTEKEESVEEPAAEENSEAEATKEETVAAAEKVGVEIMSEEVPEVVAEVEEVDDSDDVDPIFSPLESYLDEKGEFDWDALEAEQDGYAPEERAKLDTVYESTLSTITEKAVTNGTVVSIGKKEVVINIGYKSEGVLAASEFRYNPDLKAGDEVPVFVEKQEDKYGQLVISHKTARIHRAWLNVNKALEDDEIIMGFVKCRTKGGLIVDVFGIEAFLPGSQIDVKPIRDYDIYVGKQMEFKVVKINHEFKNVVVSHKALIEAELEEQKKQIISGLEKGQVLEGTVKNITSYGVFIDLGGVDGLVHITDLSWGRINHPEEVVELDQKLNVVILDFDDDKKRIALGLKQLTDHPWDALSEKLQVSDKVKGRVVVLADYGAFVEIQPGVEGLIHVSEMSWSQHLRSAQDFLNVGDEVEAEILTLDREARKMSLGMKQLMADPWEGIEDKYPVESKHSAKIRNFTNFGVFVELEEGVDGLIHISDLSWAKKVKHPSEFCTIGEQIDVVVLELDKDNRRLSLGHKQLEENPWDVFEGVFTQGSVHPGTVIKKEGSQFIVYLPHGVEGYCTAKHLKKEDGSTADIDEKLDVVVLEFNKNAKRIVVSHLRTYEDQPAKESPRSGGGSGSSRGGMKSVQSNLEKTTLGDVGGVLSDLKQEMEKGKDEPAPKKAKAKKPAAEAVVEETETVEAPAEVPEAKEKPAAKKPAAKKPAAKKPAAKKAPAKKPAAKKAPVKKAAAKKTAKKDDEEKSED
jgi:small subunit ribosomal protein S1